MIRTDQLPTFSYVNLLIRLVITSRWCLQFE
jgi:hypothetical protein